MEQGVSRFSASLLTLRCRCGAQDSDLDLENLNTREAAMQWLWASEAAEAAAHRSPSKPTSPKPSPFAKKRWLWASDETPSPNQQTLEKIVEEETPKHTEKGSINDLRKTQSRVVGGQNKTMDKHTVGNEGSVKVVSALVLWGLAKELPNIRPLSPSLRSH